MALKARDTTNRLSSNMFQSYSCIVFVFCIFYLLHMIILHKVTVRKKGLEKGMIQLANYMSFKIKKKKKEN